MAKEIELPTKSKQDDIYSDTQYIKNEFPVKSGGIKSVQRGVESSFDLSGTKEISISEVDVDKTFINIINLVGASFGSSASVIILTLKDSTTLELKSDSKQAWGKDFGSLSWEVIEFK